MKRHGSPLHRGDPQLTFHAHPNHTLQKISPVEGESKMAAVVKRPEVEVGGKGVTAHYNGLLGTRGVVMRTCGVTS